MRKEKDLSSSSVKGKSRIPKPVSGDTAKVGKHDNSNSRTLRSNSRSSSSTRPIRINRDCLKEIPATRDRVVKRTRPFIQKIKSDGSSECSNATPSTSAIKPRVPVSSAIKPRVPESSVIKPRVPESSVIKPRSPVPRITSHCCVKPVISQTTTQSTRVLRSHVLSKRPVQSSKTDTSAVAKLSTVNTSTPTSTRVLRTPVSSSRDALTTNVKSNIPKFTWNLRSRSSVSKPECKTAKGDETKPSRKRVAVNEPEDITVGKRLSIRRDRSLCSKKQKQEPQVVKAEQKESNKVLEVKQPQKQQKKADLKDDLKFSKSGLADAEHEATESQQTKAQLEEQQPDLKKSAEHLVLETLEERPLTPEDSEVKILGTEEKLNQDEGRISSSKTCTPVLAAKFPGETVARLPITPLAKEVPKEHFLVANAETIKSEKSLEIIATSLATELQTTVETSTLGKDQLSSDEKPASSKSFQVEIPPVTKRRCEEESVCDDIPVVKPRLEQEIALTTSEVISPNCSDAPSIIVEDISPVKTPALVEEFKSKRLLAEPSEPATVVKEQINPVTTSACSKPTRDARVVLNGAKNTPASKDKPLAESEQKQSRSKSIKRPASLTPIDNNVLRKKWRSLSIENGQDKSSPFSLSVQFCSSQTMDIGNITPAVSNQDMEVDKSGVLPFACNLNSSEDMELCDSGNSQILPFSFGTNQTMCAGQPCGFTFASTGQQVGQPSFGFNQATSQQFGFRRSPLQNSLQTVATVHGFSQTGIQAFGFNVGNIFGNAPQIPGLASGVVNQASNQAQQMTFGSVPQAPPPPELPTQNNQPMCGISFNQVNPPQTFAHLPKAPPLPTGIHKQSDNRVFGSVPQQVNQPLSMFGNVPKTSSLSPGGFNTSNQQFTFGSAPCQTSQSSPMSGVNQINPPQTHHAKTLNIRPTLSNSDRSRRKFIFAKGCRRRNVVKPPVHQTSNQPQVFGNSFQPNPRQVFGDFTQNPTPMESEDVSNLSKSGTLVVSILNNQPRNVLNKQNPLGHGDNQVIFGNGSKQVTFGSLMPTTGQNMNDHSMEESVQSPSSMISNGILPYSTTMSWFAISNQTMQTRTTLQQTWSLPQITVTSTVRIPPPQRQLPTFYSSVSTLSSSKSEIDGLIDSLSDTLSNCSLEDNSELDDIEILTEKFKTLSITDKPLDNEVEASKQ